MANPNTPIPQSPIGENFQWRDWFQRLSNRVYGSLSSQNSNGVDITGGTIDNTAIGSKTPSTGSFTSLKLGAPLDVEYGGTNGFAIPRAGAVAYGNGGAYAFTNVGTSGQVLTSTGSGAPVWTTGGAGPTGPAGPAVYLEADYQEQDMFLVPGSQGPQGNTGPTGATGPQGIQGPQGTQGLPGTAANPIGIDGDQGDDGMVIPGPQGPQGVTGNTGAQGVPGVAVFVTDGLDGDDGQPIPGPIGATGSQGVQGNTGAQGPAGPAIYLEADSQEPDMFLVQGNQGIQGSTGNTGPQGPQGPAVYLEADSQDPEMFLVPGNQGIQGPQGIQGTQGTPGISVLPFDGEDGQDSMPVPGPQGIQGPQGTQGVQGTQGLPGVSVYFEVPEPDEPMLTAPTVPVNSSIAWSVPVTKTANFTLGVFDTYVINNKSGSTCTVTLPAASAYPGRPINFINYQAFTLVSASSNVVPVGGGAAGTAILAASVGDATLLVSDGTNWIQMNYVPNNCLLLN